MTTAEGSRRVAGAEKGFSFETSTRIGLWATLASAGIGIFLALLQVQGWTVPKLLALALAALLLGAVVVAVSMIAVEAWRWIRRFLKQRATSASWVQATAPGLLDFEADGVRAQNRFTKELNKLNDDTESLGKKLERHSRRLERLRAKSAKRKQRAANRSAKSINRSAVYIEKRLELFKAIVKDIERNYRGLITAGTIETEEDFDAVSALRNVLDAGSTTTAGALMSVAGYRVSVEEVEAQTFLARYGSPVDGLRKG